MCVCVCVCVCVHACVRLCEGVHTRLCRGVQASIVCVVMSECMHRVTNLPCVYNTVLCGNGGSTMNVDLLNCAMTLVGEHSFLWLGRSCEQGNCECPS